MSLLVGGQPIRRFFADGKLKIIEASGGPAMVVAELQLAGQEAGIARNHPVCDIWS